LLKEKLSQCLPKADPLERPDYIEAEIQAIRAVWRGEADARQQRMALDFLVRAFGTHDTSFRPSDPHLTSFSEGKRHAGTTIVWAINVAPTKTDPDKIAIRNIGDDPNARADNRPDG
jgi:hypothetical protein